MIHERELHCHILQQIEAAMGRRSWSWLAEESGVAQSTLSSQVGKPKFSIEVLLRIAEALNRDVGYFLPGVGCGEPGATPANEALDQILEIVARARRSR